MPDDFAFAFDRMRRAAAGLPQVEETTWYGTPALAVRGKSFCRVKDADTVVVLVALEEKEILLQAAPEFYFETDHYTGWPAMLVRIRKIPVKELAHRLRYAWLLKAPKTVAKLLADRADGAAAKRVSPLTPAAGGQRAATEAPARPRRARPRPRR